MSESGGPKTGTLEIDTKGYGFLRTPDRSYGVCPDDPFVPAQLIRRFGLRGGETVTGPVERGRPPKAKKKKNKDKRNRRDRNDRQQNEPGYPGGPRLVEVTAINDQSCDAYGAIRKFEDLTVIDPREPLHFETEGGPTSMRIVDLMTPIGKGQRGLIVAPPRTGKTILLQQIAAGIACNHPDIYMMVLLVDERPEEVTEMRRTVHGEVVASSNDKDVASHVRVARLVSVRAKRMVEAGKDVLILLDSLTRLGRAFNAFIRGSGRIMSGGLDARALEEPKSVFGAARNIENGGSLTIIASCLIETGSRMDELIFNEFKGTGNMEIVLDRDMANKRVWPAINLQRSGTRKEELLLTPKALDRAYKIRRVFDGRAPDREMEELAAAMEKYPNNEAFIEAGPS